MNLRCCALLILCLLALGPVIVNGEMVAEYHRWYGSAAAMIIPEIHDKLRPPGK